MSKPIDYVAEGEENEALRWRDAEIATLRAKLAAAVVVYGGDGHYSHDALTKARAIVDAALKGAR